MIIDNNHEAVVNEIVDNLSNSLLFIDEHTETPKQFRKLIETYYGYIKQGFEYEKLRKCPVHFKFNHEEGATLHSLELRHFITNIFMWEPVVILGHAEDLDDSYIVDAKKINSNSIKEFIDNKIIIPYRERVSNKKLNIVIHDMIFNLGNISTDFNRILGLSMSIETFMDVANKNERFNEIIRTKLDESLQPTEIESTIQKLMYEQIDILLKTDNFLQPMLRAGSGIKDKQLAEFAINGGLKPDLGGNTIPIPINNNFIVGGLNTIQSYFIDSLGGRKSLIMNSTTMGRSGHFARMMMLLGTTVKMQHNVDDCGSLHPLKIHVKSPKHLERLKGRNYRELYSRVYKVIKGDETHLIGEDILVRSPITCATKHVCKKCYGDLYYTNSDLESVGGYAGAKITEPLTQNILSSKHLLTTDSNKIEFSENFYRFFSINANEIVVDLHENENIKDLSIHIIRENVKEIVQYDETEFNAYVNVFHIFNSATGEMFEIHELNNMDLYISPELRELLEAEVRKNRTAESISIPFSNLEMDERVFVTEIMNNELTRPLYNIINLMNLKGNDGYDTIEKMANRFLDLLIESKISADSVHAEIMIRPLIRDKDDILAQPNFKDFKAMKNYQILTVVAALENHPSVTLSISFQNLKSQLGKALTFRKRDTSFIDSFYRQ